MNGRPPSVIDEEVVKELRHAGLRWSAICQILHVSDSTLRRWRKKNDFEVTNLNYICIEIDNYHVNTPSRMIQSGRPVLNDAVADELIQQYTSDNPSRGERMIIGMVRASTDASFTRDQLRSSIRRVDEVGLESRTEAFGRRIER